MRRAAKVDLNHAEAVDNLRAAGWRVFSIAVIGGGVPDLVAARDGFTCLLEIKSGGKKPNADQRQFLKDWPGMKAVVHDAGRAATTAEQLKRIYDLKDFGL